jgi:hypothetical protein
LQWIEIWEEGVHMFVPRMLQKQILQTLHTGCKVLLVQIHNVLIEMKATEINKHVWVS